MNYGWYLSALFYDGIGYSKLMHDIDGYTIGFLANIEKLKGAKILDVAAGTGNIDFKLVEAGARSVVAVENNPGMLSRLKAKQKRKPEFEERIKILEKDMYTGIYDEIANGAFDVQLFRRCLYSSEDKVRDFLSRSFEHLADDGIMFIVHPEADKEKYFDNGLGGIAWSHVLKWHIANIGKKISSIEYQKYTQPHLESICKESCSGAEIKFYTPIRPAYNIAIIRKREPAKTIQAY